MPTDIKKNNRGDNRDRDPLAEFSAANPVPEGELDRLVDEAKMRQSLSQILNARPEPAPRVRRRPPRRSLYVRLAGATAIAGAVAAAMLVTGGTNRLTGHEFIQRAYAEITQPNGIVHVIAVYDQHYEGESQEARQLNELNPPKRVEYWDLTGPGSEPYSRTKTWDASSGKLLSESLWAPGKSDVRDWDAHDNKIHVPTKPLPPRKDGASTNLPPNPESQPVAFYRAALANEDCLRLNDETEVNGRQAYEVVQRPGCAAGMDAPGSTLTIFIDRNTYQPIRMTSRGPTSPDPGEKPGTYHPWQTFTEDYLKIEVLPLNDQTRREAFTMDEHPGAKVLRDLHVNPDLSKNQ